MEWRIERCGDHQTLVFAAEELARYVCQMDPGITAAILKGGASDGLANALRLQVGGALVPAVKDAALDDAYGIDITDGAGVIAGSNERSVLLGVYRFLYELGCRWLRPGADGERIPRRSIAHCRCTVTDAASYRHRGVCIEGSCSFAHVAQLIDWMPKVGMNGYYNQFRIPFTFYDRWYKHQGNPYMTPQPASLEEISAMSDIQVEQMKKRGMMYHATGHGWTCEPFGIPGTSWDAEEYDLSEETREMLALVGGKRDIWQGISLNTNLCYSNPKARGKIVSAITAYCREHSEVDYLHFWLADGWNNHCECENCQKATPADWYVTTLNEIDESLTKAGISTKIVFLIYVDLLWEPQTERLRNPGRFTLMFAPITRTYSSPFFSPDAEGGKPVELAPYVRNKLVMPKSVSENVARLARWQEQFSGDSFDYDYHLIWDCMLDLGSFSTARVLFEDMKNLDKLGLNGMMSCQVQRAFFPTGLAMNGMAAALWNKNLDFDTYAKRYFDDMFGEDACTMQAYFQKLTELFHPPYLRYECPLAEQAAARRFAEIPKLVNGMLPLIAERCASGCEHKTWTSLWVHGQLCIYVANALEALAGGNQESAVQKWETAKDYICRMEPEIHALLDVKFYVDVVGRFIRGERHLG